jgi:hypothetical protein
MKLFCVYTKTHARLVHFLSPAARTMSETNQRNNQYPPVHGGCICQDADESHLPFLSCPSRRPFPPPLRSTRSNSKFSRRGSDPSWDPHRFLPFLRGFPGSLFSPPRNPPADPLLLPRRLSLLVGASSEEGLGWCGEASRRRDLAGGDGRREGADRGEVPAVRRHRHRPQQVRPLHHRRRAQGVCPLSVAAG